MLASIGNKLTNSCRQVVVRLPHNSHSKVLFKPFSTSTSNPPTKSRTLGPFTQFIRCRPIKRSILQTKPAKLAERFNMEWPKITLFGDSITRRSFDANNGCWGSLIAYQVGDYFDVDARGFEGYNTRWSLELMPQLFPKSYLDKVEIFIEFFGHNDSWCESSPLHVPVVEYESNLRAMIKYLESNGLEQRKIILMTPSWYHLDAFKEYLKELKLPPTDKSLESARLYSEAVQRVAKDHQDIGLVDIFAASLKYEPLEELFCDGVHFSNKGAQLVFDHLMPLLEKKLVEGFKRPLGDLFHVTPLDQRDEVKRWVEAYFTKRASKY